MIYVYALMQCVQFLITGQVRSFYLWIKITLHEIKYSENMHMATIRNHTEASLYQLVRRDIAKDRIKFQYEG